MKLLQYRVTVSPFGDIVADFFFSLINAQNSHEIRMKIEHCFWPLILHSWNFDCRTMNCDDDDDYKSSRLPHPANNVRLLDRR